MNWSSYQSTEAFQLWCVAEIFGGIIFYLELTVLHIYIYLKTIIIYSFILAIHFILFSGELKPIPLHFYT